MAVGRSWRRAVRQRLPGTGPISKRSKVQSSGRETATLRGIRINQLVARLFVSATRPSYSGYAAGTKPGLPGCPNVCIYAGLQPRPKPSPGERHDVLPRMPRLGVVRGQLVNHHRHDTDDASVREIPGPVLTESGRSALFNSYVWDDARRKRLL